MPLLPLSARTRRLVRSLAKAIALLLLLLAACALFWLRHALYHRFIRFPREEAAWQVLRQQRQSPPLDPVWKEFRGIVHSHSLLSHDSEVPFEEILRVLQRVPLDFICLSDHCVDGRADFNWQWRGLHDGKLFIPGFEMKNGYLPLGAAPGTVLSNATDPAVLAQQIAATGGLLLYAHPEEPRDWDRPELAGMEIYNLHADFKQQKLGLGRLLPEAILNLRRYPDHIYWQIFRRPTDFLQRWDSLNRERHMTGVAGNDCHQNVGFRAFYTSDGTIRLEDTSPRTLKTFHLNMLTRPLARLAFGPLTPGRKLFHIQLDPYERSARFVNTHVLARELTEPAVLDALRAGRVFIGFDLVADSSGFRWSATDGPRAAVMGEAMPYSPAARLHVRSPLPGRFTLVKDGAVVERAEGLEVDWAASGPAKYRVEVELKMLDEWMPWIYANPIALIAPTLATPAP